MSQCSYYDIDEILAEEELIPVTNNLNFFLLAHLDPDYSHSARSQSRQAKNILLEGTRFKMPLWSIKKWAELNYLTVRIPKHYGKRARERLNADPVSVDLRKWNERYYRSGMAIVRLINSCPDDSIPEILKQESESLKETLLVSYVGTRMRRIFDWTLSSIEDDVSHYTKRLSQMELALFQRGAQASHAHAQWKLYGTRRIHVSESALRTSALDQDVRGMTVTPMEKKRSVEQMVNRVSPELGVTSFLNDKRKRSRIV